MGPHTTGVNMKAQASVIADSVQTDTGSNPSNWQQLRVSLREHFGETAFRRWFQSVTASVAAGIDGPVLTLSLPTRFMCDWVEAHYGDTVRTLWRQSAKGSRVDFIA